jgi:hypothetical protein
VHEVIAMANTTFTGPVNSLNGFSGTVLTVASATISNLTFTSVSTASPSGTVATQAGRIPVLVGSTTLYIALYSSLTP